MELQRHKRAHTLTQYELAEKLGISDAQMSKILNGHVSVEYEQAVRICEELGLDFLKVVAEAEKKANVLRLSL